MALPISLTALNRRFPGVSFVRNRNKNLSRKPIGVVNRKDQSVIFCEAIMVIDVPWYDLEKGVSILATDGLICAVAFNKNAIESSFQSFLLREKITRHYVS